jgi:hypothetical protein
MGGSVRRRDGRWEYRYDAGLDPVTGRRSRPGGSGFPTYLAAQQALRQAQHAHATTTQPAIPERDAGLTVLAYLTAWLSEVAPHLRSATTNAYGRYIATHIGPAIGNLPLRDLTAGHRNQLYAHLLADGHLRRPGGLSPKSVVNIHRMLHRALTPAVRQRLVSPSVIDHAQPPELPHRRRTGSGAPQPSLRADREAATILAALILDSADGRKVDAGMVTERSQEAENPPTTSRFRRSAGPSTSSGGGI